MTPSKNSEEKVKANCATLADCRRTFEDEEDDDGPPDTCQRVQVPPPAWRLYYEYGRLKHCASLLIVVTVSVSVQS
jgi:hypothetical protein